jgi:hypothetical protein
MSQITVKTLARYFKSICDRCIPDIQAGAVVATSNRVAPKSRVQDFICVVIANVARVALRSAVSEKTVPGDQVTSINLLKETQSFSRLSSVAEHSPHVQAGS